MDVADLVGLEPFALRLGLIDRQPGDAVALEAAMQGAAAEVGDSVLQAAQHIVQRQQRLLPERHDDGFLCRRQHRTLRRVRPHQSRSINYRISGARVPVLKDLDAFIFDDTPVDEGHIRELAAGEFIDARRNLIVIGGTGTGKTHLAIAIAAAVIRARTRGRFFNLVDLVNQLE